MFLLFIFLFHIYTVISALFPYYQFKQCLCLFSYTIRGALQEFLFEWLTCVPVITSVEVEYLMASPLPFLLLGVWIKPAFVQTT